MINPQNGDDAVVFAIPGDLHLTEAGLENHRVACQVVDEVNRLIRPDFVQFIGDNVQHAQDEEFRLFGDLAGGLTVPHFALVGDHDRNGSDVPEMFIDHLGDPYGSAELRGFRFIRLNTQESRPAGLTDDQLDWMDQEFQAAQEVRQRVVLFQHNYPYKVYEQFAGPGIRRWQALVDQHRPVVILCGHTHYAQTANDGRNVYVATRSIGDPEGGPAGYLLALVDGDDFAVKHRCPGESAAVALITHPREALLATSPWHIVSGRDLIRVRTWSLESLLGVQWRLDDTNWRDLRPQAGNVWSSALPTDILSKGEHRIDVAAIGQGGDVVARDAVTFIFDPTRRYTAVPMVRPVVKETAYC